MRTLRLLGILAVLLTAALAPLPSKTASAAVTTSVQTVADRGAMMAIDCPTVSACYTMAMSEGKLTQFSIANGTVTAGATEIAQGVTYLRDLACASPSACYVVGQYGLGEGPRGSTGGNLSSAQVALTIDNGTISTAEQFVDGISFMFGIDCPSSNACYALGEGDFGHPGIHVVSLAVDGESITSGTPQVVPGASILVDIACPSTSVCYAVGNGPSGGVVVPISVDGNLVSVGNTQTIAGTSHLRGIACPSVYACYAVGELWDGGVMLSLAVDGGSINAGGTQAIAGTTSLHSIACASASTCYAVGGGPSGGMIVPFAIFNSVAQSVPGVPLTITGIACPGTTCYAVSAATFYESIVVTIEPQALISTNVTISSAANPSGYGQTATFTATVAATGGTGLPTGWVQFYIDDIAFGAPVPLNNHLGQAQAVLTLLNLPVGSHGITGIYGGDTNFSGSLTTSRLTQTVNKALLTIAADNKSVDEGAALPELTYTPSGFVAGDTASVLTGSPSLSTTAMQGSAPGEYPITIGPGTLSAANYSFAFASGGTLTINSINDVPTADAGTDQTVSEGATVALDGSNSSDPDEDSLTYSWELVSHTGPAVTLSSDTATKPTFATTDNGSYTFQLTVSDGQGGTDHDDVVITVDNAAPTATFNTPDTVDEGSPIALAFTDPSDSGSADTQAGFSYAFDCGNGYGDFGAATTASCLTSDNGTRTVKGTIRDKDGTVSEYTEQVTITNVAPTATFNSPAAVDEGGNIELSLSDPADLSSADTQAGFSYAFDCGKGYGDFGTTSTASCPTSDNGSLTVKGQIQDQHGGISEYSKQVTINNVAPAATFNSPDAVDEGGDFSLSLSNPLDPSSVDTQAGFSYAFDCGDGYGTFGANNTAACSASGSASITVKGTIRDKDGDETEYTATVAIVNVPPTVTIDNAPSTSREGTAITLTSTVTDPGGVATLSYAWSVTKDGNAFTSGAGADFSFTPDDDGVYAVALTVTDQGGGEGLDSATITVENVAPTLVDLSSPTIDENGTATVSGTINDPGGLDSVTLVIDWGEGDLVTYEYAAGTSAFSETHQYLDDDPSGTMSDVYAVGLTLTDKDSGEGTAGTSVTVANLLPVIAEIASESHGSIVTVSVTAGDPGPQDTLSYAFDCDHDGDYDLETGTTASGECDMGIREGTFTIGVQVSDDDGGVEVGTVEAVIETWLCANRYSGVMRYAGEPDCRDSATLLSLPEDEPLTFCANSYTGLLRYAASGDCGGYQTSIVLPDEGSLAICISHYTGTMRLADDITECRTYENPRIIGVSPEQPQEGTGAR